MARKTWGEKWGESPVDYNLTYEESVKLLKKLMNITKRRVASLKKSSYYSFAAEVMLEDEKGKSILDKNISAFNNRYKTLAAISRLHDFWAAETSTLAGTKRVSKAQNARIFGADNRGEPLYWMTKDESKAFWALYHTYLNTHPETTHFDSTRMQVVIGEMYRAIGRPTPESDDNTLPAINVAEFIDMAKEALQADHDDDIVRYRELIEEAEENFRYDGGFKR